MQLMGKYIFIRHGESNINVLGVLSGDSDAGHIVGSKLNETKIETSSTGINFIKSERVEYYNTSSKNMVLNITEFEDNSSDIAHNSYIYEIHLYG